MALKAVRLATGDKAEKNRRMAVCVKNVGAKPLLCPDMVRLIGIEPTHPAPEAGALSTELQAHMKSHGLVYHTFSKKQSNF